MIKSLLIGVMILLLTACSYMPASSKVQNRNKAYLSAQSEPPLRIPPGLSSHAFHNNYPVANRAYPPQNSPAELLPPGIEAK